MFHDYSGSYMFFFKYSVAIIWYNRWYNGCLTENDTLVNCHISLACWLYTFHIKLQSIASFTSMSFICIAIFHLNLNVLKKLVQYASILLTTVNRNKMKKIYNVLYSFQQIHQVWKYNWQAIVRLNVLLTFRYHCKFVRFIDSFRYHFFGI